MSSRPSLRRRPHLRRRSHTLSLDFGPESFHIFTPPADDPIVITAFSDAVGLAWSLLDLPVEREALVLLDERRVVTAILLDPPPSVGVLVGWTVIPGLEVPFSQTLSVVVGEPVQPGPPQPIDVEGYHSLRRAHMLQGLLLLDVLIVDTDTIRSLAVGCDPDPVWDDDFDPLIDTALDDGSVADREP